jgi:DNA polymerase III epsilon subunit-like protein
MMDLYVVDFEGSLHYGVVEYGVVRLAATGITEVFTGMCRPDRAVSPKDVLLHGLREDRLREFPGFDTHRDLFYGFRCRGLLAAHHAPVEQGLLNRYWHTLQSTSADGHPYPVLGSWGPWVDSRHVSRHYHQFDSHSLMSVIEALGLEGRLVELGEAHCPEDRRRPHCALYDALASALILLHSREAFGATLEDWVSVSQSGRGADWRQGSFL